jgi:monoamine oxidase
MRALAGQAAPAAETATTAAPAARPDHVTFSDDDDKRNLAPCHDFLASDKVHEPVPVIDPGAWQNAKHYDVVVVGAGMSGLHTAWKLRGLDKGDPPPDAPNIAIFERTNHVGGRARSTKVDGASIPIDLGAMRFSRQLHPLVSGIADHFALKTREFPVSGDQNLQYFRGVRHTNAEVAANPQVMPFNVADNEKGKTANELVGMAIEAVVPNFKSLTDEQWATARTSTTVPITDPGTGTTSNVPLSQLGLQNILRRTLSKEAVAFVTSSLGYRRYEMNWDAGAGLQTLSENFVPNVQYETPLDGMKAFPRALAGDLQKHGTDINKKQTLRQISYDADKKQFHLIFQSFKGEVTPVVADKVVLAMPKAPLDELVYNSPFLQGTTLDKNLGKVTPIKMSRIFMTFPRAWWNDQGIQGGRSLTDLPVNQVYYYGQDGDVRPYVQAYVDGDKADYLEGLQNPGNPGVGEKLCVTPQLAAELHSELEELHGRQIPAPDGFLYKCWGDKFFGGATHAWNKGSNPVQTSQQMIAPLDGMPLYVCGEAFSLKQGWIEGALQTSEQVLARMGTPATQP